MYLDEETPRKKKFSFSLKKIGFTLFFLIILISGALLQHYVVEPFLDDSLESELAQLSAENTLLNEENLSCISEKNALQEELNARES